MTRRTVFSAISLTLLCPFIPALATDNGNAAEDSAALPDDASAPSSENKAESAND